jgi:hypothetical protein
LRPKFPYKGHFPDPVHHKGTHSGCLNPCSLIFNDILIHMSCAGCDQAHALMAFEQPFSRASLMWFMVASMSFEFTQIDSLRC